MKNKTLISLLFLLVLSISCAPVVTTETQQALYEVKVLENVSVPMRDGVNLKANIFLPEAEGKFPAVVMRTPYGKGGVGSEGSGFASNGYVFVAQDCRGRGPSEGNWYPGVNERNDGLDTHKWVLAQPWCNGKIGTVGGSYVGYTQWITAPDAGDYLKAMFTAVPLFDWYEDCAYIGGAMNLAQMLDWGTNMAKPPKGQQGTDRKKRNRKMAHLHLPLSTWDKVIGFEVQYLRDWVAHPEFDSYWQQYRMTDSLERVDVPNITISGWYDIFVSQAFENINRLKTESRSSLARQNQYMIVGPWTHSVGPRVGQLHFGKEAQFRKRYFQKNWFDHWLKGQDSDVDQWPPLRIFVMGANEWRDENEWPLKRTKYTPYYLHSRKKANGLSDDGTLSTLKPSDENPDSYIYDPSDPVPTRGGCNLTIPAGSFDQRKIERRHDVLVFTSKVLKEEVEVTGPVKVILYASSSAKDTDWTGKLVDVYPDGRAMNICDGIIRARYRDGGKAKLIEPGKIYRYEIDLWPTSNVFLAGHRIRLEISSSNFPRFDRNPNTGGKFGTDEQTVEAEQTVYHDALRPSHILLPVIPN